MIARALLVVVTALVLFACASIDPPAPFTKPEAGADPSFVDAGPFDRCRVLERRIDTNVSAKVYGDPGGPQAVCMTMFLDVSGGGQGAVVFCVAGDLDDVNVPQVRDLSPDLRTCAYCTDVQTSCSDPDGGAPVTCGTAYAPIAGRARIVRFGRAAGDPIWVDIGALVVARVTRRDATSFDLERRDCIFADGLTLQGLVQPAVAPACAGLEATACSIASTASSRSP